MSLDDNNYGKKIVTLMNDCNINDIICVIMAIGCQPSIYALKLCKIGVMLMEIKKYHYNR